MFVATTTFKTAANENAIMSRYEVYCTVYMDRNVIFVDGPAIKTQTRTASRLVFRSKLEIKKNRMLETRSTTVQQAENG